MVPSLEGVAPFQIAFVVRDLREAAEGFDLLLDTGPWSGWVQGGDWSVRLARNGIAPQYELIEPLGWPSVHADWLHERGEGFHHVAYAVDSLAQVEAEMEEAGYPVIARIDSFGEDGDGAAAYFDTSEEFGFLVEAVELPDRMPPTDFILSV